MVSSPLPIDDALADVLAAIGSDGAVVLRAPTGAGKTTRVPPALLDANPTGRVLVLEPRRVAARAAARRIASERHTPLGREVGYHVRFERVASSATRLLVVTEGILLRLLQDDPFLERFTCVVFDEFHERSLDADLALALCQRVRSEVRPELQLVVMSATLDPEPVASFLGAAPIVESRGRQYPVEIRHRALDRLEPLERGVRRAVEDALPETPGHVLVFLPGVGEIRRCARHLQGAGRALDADVLELHGELAPERQDAVLGDRGRRKVILATNVAETSLTIPGVTCVVDTGLERLPRVDPRSGLERLETVRIARESADQRAGRAGRERDGLALRLWSQAEDARLADRREPAIRRSELAGAALQLLAWGEPDVASFPFFEAPPPYALERALDLLRDLGALDATGLTSPGRAMAQLPVHPRLARLLAESADVGHLPRLALAAALLADRWPFERPGPSEVAAHHGPSDILDGVIALEAFEQGGRVDVGAMRLKRGAARHTLRARDQLVRMGRRIPAKAPRSGDADDAVLRALFVAFADRLGRMRPQAAPRALLLGGRGARIAPSSIVQDSELFVAVDVDAGRRGERSEARVRLASVVDRAWLDSDRVRTREAVSFDAQRQVVVGTRQTLYDDLLLEEVALKTPRGKEVEDCLLQAASADLAAALPLEDEVVDALRRRVACLRLWRPELDLPALDDEALRALLSHLVRGCRSFADLRRAALADHLRGRLTWPQLQALDREAPERIEVPSGSRVRLSYEVGRPPILAVRIQEVFGMLETPRVAGGRVKVLMHLLAPNHRPQQITDDMPSFWKNTYAVVRGELRRRYPRHAWPEDPMTAKAQRRPRGKRRR